MTTNEESSSNALALIQVKRAVYSWSIRHPEAGYTNEQLARIAHEYHEDLVSEGVTAREFESVAREARKRCRFFPKMVDLLDALQQHRKRPPEQPTSGAIRIEEVTSHHDLTPEEIERNKARVKAITNMLAGKITMDEAIEAVDNNTHIEVFGIQEAGQLRPRKSEL